MHGEQALFWECKSMIGSWVERSCWNEGLGRVWNLSLYPDYRLSIFNSFGIVELVLSHKVRDPAVEFHMQNRRPCFLSPVSQVSCCTVLSYTRARCSRIDPSYKATKQHRKSHESRESELRVGIRRQSSSAIRGRRLSRRLTFRRRRSIFVTILSGTCRLGRQALRDCDRINN